MVSTMLTERQKRILRAIVDNYIRSGEPVGSRTISKREDIGFSPATVRNEMADLEEMGYLEQPHTSAGRIPSEKGYRFYVDHLMEPVRLKPEEIRRIRQLFAQRLHEFEEVIRQTATILASLTNYTAVVLGPEIYETRLKQLAIVPLSTERAVAVIVTNTGRVEHHVVDVPPDLPLSDVERMVNWINHRLVGLPLYMLKQRIDAELAEELRRESDRCALVLQLLDRALTVADEDAERVFVGGTTNILAQPEFRDVEKVRALLGVLERSDLVVELFATREDGVRVRIGRENANEAVQGCSIITASYSVDGKLVGTVGILGPTRMEYGRVVGILEHFAQDLSALLSRLYSA